MATYEGYLLKIKDTVFPLKYIVSGTYKSTDNQRTELKANRNESNLLVRQTSPNFKTKIEFETPILFLDEYEEIRNILNQGIINVRERKIQITYWNSEELKYKEAICYMPDIDYQPKNQMNGELIYDAMRLAFIEY